MEISAIYIYPIKSLKGISLENSQVEKRGLRFDRRWMLTDVNGIFLTQREVPKMATISVELLSGALAVTAAAYGTIEIPFEPDRGERETVTVWDSRVAGETYVGAMNEWFSDVLSRRCRLVRMPDSTERHVNSDFDLGSDIVSFADGFPLLLIGESSLYDLNERIAKNAVEGATGRGEMPESDYAGNLPEPLLMERFRPSVVITGSNPFEEDNWAAIRIGEASFRVVKPCGRCVITTIDQSTGQFDGSEPLRTLATFRKASQIRPDSYQKFGHGPNSVLFGENLIPESEHAAIGLGDVVTVVERRKTANTT